MRVPPVTVLARDMRLDVFGKALEMLRVPLVTIVARDMRLKFFSTILGDGMSAASQNIGARYFNRRNFRMRKNCVLKHKQTFVRYNYRTARAVSHTLVYVHGFRMLQNFVCSAKSTKNTKLSRVRKFLRLQYAIKAGVDRSHFFLQWSLFSI